MGAACSGRASGKEKWTYKKKAPKESEGEPGFCVSPDTGSLAKNGGPGARIDQDGVLRDFVMIRKDPEGTCPAGGAPA